MQRGTSKRTYLFQSFVDTYFNKTRVICDSLRSATPICCHLRVVWRPLRKHSVSDKARYKNTADTNPILTQDSSSPSFSRRRCNVARKKAETQVPEQLWEDRYLPFGSFWCLCYSSARPKPWPKPGPPRLTKAHQLMCARARPTPARTHFHFCQGNPAIEPVWGKTWMLQIYIIHLRKSCLQKRLVGFLFGAVVLPRTHPDERGMGPMEQYMFTRCNGASPCTYTGGGTDFEKDCNALGGSTKSALGNDYCFYKGQLTIFTRCNGASPCTYTGGGTDFEKDCNALGGSTKSALGNDYCFYKGQLTIFTRCNGASPCTYTGGGTDFEKDCNALGGSTKSALGNDYCFYKGQLTIFTRCNGASPCTYTGGGTDFEKDCNALGGSTKSALGNDYCFYKGQLTIFTRCNGVSPCTYTGGGTDFEKACNELDGSTNDALGQDYCFLKGELGMISQKSKGTAMLLAELHLEDYTNDAPWGTCKMPHISLPKPGVKSANEPMVCKKNISRHDRYYPFRRPVVPGFL